MYIQDRLFSETTEEVKYYSVVMTEEEYNLYSEFQKEFARFHYSGLNTEQVKWVKQARSRAAKLLNTNRNSNNAVLNSTKDKALRDKLHTHDIAESEYLTKRLNEQAKKWI